MKNKLKNIAIILLSVVVVLLLLVVSKNYDKYKELENSAINLGLNYNDLVNENQELQTFKDDVEQCYNNAQNETEVLNSNCIHNIVTELEK